MICILQFCCLQIKIQQGDGGGGGVRGMAKYNYNSLKQQMIYEVFFVAL